MSRQNLRSSRHMGFESLEGRQLMAGNVLVSVTGGDLVVTGDSQENQVQIIQAMQNGAPIAGRFFIAGQNGTAINGQGAGQFFNNVNHDLRINLNGANDRLTMGDGVSDSHFIVPNDLVIAMGDGNDVLTIDRIRVRDDATITTGNGADSVTFKGSVGALSGVDGGANDLSIDTGARNDNVSLQNVFVRRNLTVNTGIDNFTDVVDMLFMNVGNNTNISTGDGSDLVRISDVGFNGDLTVNTGAGNDAVSLTRCQVDEFFANFAANDDTLTLRDTSGRRATLDGGSGINTLLRTNSPFSQSFQAPNF